MVDWFICVVVVVMLVRVNVGVSLSIIMRDEAADGAW